MENNISNIKDCYGCGVCATVCPKHIIDIKLNHDGFYEPHIIDDDACIHCGLCVNVCAFSHSDLALKDTEIHSYAAWSNEYDVQRKCSSGGAGFELGRLLLKKEYKVCGVRYNAENQRAEHYIATTEEELIPTIGSKYIQSYTVDGFKGINRKEKYLVTGTPCQIDSFRRYIQKYKVEDNFVLMDFFCHCVPSLFAWKVYLKSVQKVTGQVTYASWRNKFTGWHDSWTMPIDGFNSVEPIRWQDSYNMLIKGKNGIYNSRKSQGDLFYQLFLGDYCSNKACSKNCKYKYNQSSADIRIGDLWGSTYKDNEDGVSAAIAFTSKGDALLKQCNCELVEHPFEIVAEGQMKKNVTRQAVTPMVIWALRNNLPISIVKSLILLTRIKNKLRF